MRNAYIRALYDLAKDNKNIMALVADNGAIVYDRFRSVFPNQFINFGISEANMVSAAAGLASCGMIPFTYTIAGFITMRAFEQIRNDVCLQNQNVKLVGVGAGITYGSLGPTHHTIEDIALMRVLPNMTILAPATPREAYQCTIEAARIHGPVYIRLEATAEPDFLDENYRFEPGKLVILHDGKDIALFGYGSIVYDLLQLLPQLEKRGISPFLIHTPSLKPFAIESLLPIMDIVSAVVVVEEHSIYGGLGSILAEMIAEKGLPKPLTRIGLEQFAKGYGSHIQIKEMNGLGKEAILERVVQALEQSKTRKET